MTNPLKADPTRTGMDRKLLTRDIRRRVNSLKREITKLIVDDDVFGMRKPRDPALNELKLASTQVNIDDQKVREKIWELQEGIDKNDVFEHEDKPHITIRYGLLPEVSAEMVRGMLADTGPIWIKFRNISVFYGEDKDVVKIDVLSPDLHHLYHKLGTLPNTTTHPDYDPHLTLSYVKPGTGYRYEKTQNSLNGVEMVFPAVVHSSPEREMTSINLEGCLEEEFVKDDILDNELVGNTVWQFLTRDQQLRQFVDWLRTQTGITILAKAHLLGELEDDHWLREHIDRVYTKGMSRAFDSVNKPQLSEKLDFYNGTREQFLRQSFARPVSVARVKLLASRAFNELQGMTDQMTIQLQRTLVDGFIQQKGPREIARDLLREVDGINKVRAERIAATEVVRAHNEGQLDAMEELGVESVGVAVEWETSGLGITAKGNPSPCKLCAPLDGIILKTGEAHGMLPRHPFCKCSWLPAGLGESDEGQQKTRKRIQRSIERSLAAEKPKANRKQRKKLSRWVGSQKKIDRKRPDPIV